jgi:outer membrane receptor protein involved in Fe transport
MSRFVDDYYLRWAGLGDKSTKALIDSQLSHSIEASASFVHQKYNISLAVNNLLDEVIYDNYEIQLPGRSYALKLRYSF